MVFNRLGERLARGVGHRLSKLKFILALGVAKNWFATWVAGMASGCLWSPQSLRSCSNHHHNGELFDDVMMPRMADVSPIARPEGPPIGGPLNAKRSSPVGKLTRGGLGKPLGRGEGAR